MTATGCGEAFRRIVSIDMLRAIAIVLMVLCHSGIYLSSPEKDPGFYFFANHVIGDFPAPLFLFLVGMSQAVSFSRKSRLLSQEGEKLNTSDGLFLKGVCLFLLSFVLSFLNSGIHYIFEWDVLSIIGFSMMVLSFLRKWNPAALIAIAIVLVLASPFVRDIPVLMARYGGYFEWNKYLDTHGFKILVDPAEEYEPVFSLKSILIGFLWSGTFPVLPCLSYPLIGLAVGKIFTNSQKKKWLAQKIMVLGTFLICLSALLVFESNSKTMMAVATQFISAYAFYPISFSMLLLQFGVTFFLFGFLSNKYDSKFKLKSAPGFLSQNYERLSRYSLTIYVLHYLIIFWPLRIAGFLEGDTDKYLSNATSAPVSFLVGILILVTLLRVTKIWDGVGGKYSLEWMLSKIRKISLSDNPYKARLLNPDP